MSQHKFLLLVLLLVTLTGTASAATIDVGSGYPHTTIAAGVAAASSGDSVHIHSGTYTISTPVSIKSGITVYGDGYGNTIVKAASKSAFASDSAAAMFQLSGVNSVNIYGLKFQGPASSTADIHDSSQTYYGGHDEYHNAIKITSSSDISIHDCYFTLLLGDGIRAGSATSVNVYNNQFVTSGHDGLQLWGIRNWRIYNNYIAVNINCGVRVANSASCGSSITYNTFTNGYSNSGWTGVQIQGSTTGLTVDHNVFTQMTDNYGVTTYSSSASGCTITNNAGYSVPNGLVVNCGSATTSNNNIYGSSQDWAALGVGWTASSTSGSGTVTPTAVYNGEPLPTRTSPSNGGSVTPTNGKITLIWDDLNSTQYQVQLSTDSGFATIAASPTTSGSSVSVAVNNSTTYYWRIRAYNDGSKVWTDYTGNWVFYTSTSVEVAIADGVSGMVTDSATGKPISGAVVTMANESWSKSVSTDENGQYSFSLYGNGTYYVSASATNYQGTGGLPVDLAEGGAEVDIALSPSQSYLAPHYVTFVVNNIFGTAYSGVVANVFEGNDTNTMPFSTGMTDGNGAVVFNLNQDKLYTITFVDPEQNIDTVRTYMPAEEVYRVLVWNAHQKAATTDNNSEIIKKKIQDIIRYHVETSEYDSANSYINQSIGVSEGSANISSWIATIDSVSWNGTVNGNFTFTASGNSTQNITTIVPNNATYLVNVTITHPDIGGVITYSKVVDVNGWDINPAFDFGWDKRWKYEAMGYVLLLLTGGLFGQRNKATGVICVMGVGLFLRYIGWFQYDLTGEIMVYVGILLVLAYMFGKRD